MLTPLFRRILCIAVGHHPPLQVIATESSEGEPIELAPLVAQEGQSRVIRCPTDWVGQHVVQDMILREWDVPGGAKIGLIDFPAQHGLDHGFHVIEGVLPSGHYGEMRRRLHDDHHVATQFFVS